MTIHKVPYHPRNLKCFQAKRIEREDRAKNRYKFPGSLVVPSVYVIGRLYYHICEIKMRWSSFQTFVIGGLLYVISPRCVAKSDEVEYGESAVSFHIEHNVPRESERDFSVRSRVDINLKDPNSKVSILQLSSSLEGKQVGKLQNMLIASELYTIRARSDPSDPSSPYVYTSIPLCMLASTNFREDLSFHLTKDKNLLAMEYRTYTPLSNCATNGNIIPSDFAFTSYGFALKPSPGPEIPTDTIFARDRSVPPGVVVEPTKDEQKKAAEENPSILRKYWYIILPILVFTLFGAEAPQPSPATATASAQATGQQRPTESSSLAEMETNNTMETFVNRGDVIRNLEETLGSNDFRLRVKMLNERVFSVTTAPETTVLRFRSQVARVTQVPSHLQRLIYRGKLLKDDKSLLHYEVQNGHTVHLVARVVTASPSTMEADRNQMRIRHENLESDQVVWQFLSQMEQEATGNTENDVGNERNVLSTERIMSTSTTTPAVARESQNPNGAALNLAMLTERLAQAESEPSDNQLNYRRRTNGISARRWRTLAANNLERDSQASSNNVQNLDYLMQGIMTLRTILSTAGSTSTESQTPSQSQFFIGQWFDVRDTVNQWMEGTVLDITDTQVLIHYHGWPSRWDEWIDRNSDRLASFRTRTTHNSSRILCPVSTTRFANAPSIGATGVGRIMSELRDVMRQTLPHIEELAHLFEGQPPSNVDASMETAFSQGPASSDRQREISSLAHLLAPAFDRLGRVLVDLSLQLEPLYSPLVQNRNASTLLSAGASAWMDAANETTMNGTAQPLNPSDSIHSQDSLLRFRDLIRTSLVSDTDIRTRPGIDVHIHAIVTPSSLASLAALARSSERQMSAQTGASTAQSPLSTLLPSSDAQIFRPINSRDGHSLLNDIDDGSAFLDSSRTPLLDGYDRQTDSIGSEIPNLEVGAMAWGNRSLAASDQDFDESIGDRGGIGIIPEIQEARDGESTEEVSFESRQGLSRFPTLLEVLRRTLRSVHDNDANNQQHSQIETPSNPIERVNEDNGEEGSIEEEDLSFFQRIGLTSRRSSRSNRDMEEQNLTDLDLLD
uniref:Ubiquitin family protein putative n=1 Tax=Albugo laibachii Nc14 TaxID=890382 RepID=F0W3R8_9STRA|nr:ubiquitin family protein putative [Albugo laibachii Nc14]|eukprot:CCA15738.1 ubiquitin family protein putative [Albugo laibachii Nc14]